MASVTVKPPMTAAGGGGGSYYASPYGGSSGDVYGTSRNTDEERTLLNTIANSHIPTAPLVSNPSAPYTYVENGEPTPSGAGAGVHYGQNGQPNLREREQSPMAYAAAPHPDVPSTAAPPTAAPPTAATAASASGRFTEDWDATQRGASLVDGVVTGGSGGSGSGSIDGASIQAPTRSNTLKKKLSVRRSASLHRSSSRRSMMAGSVRSLALQSRTDLDESHSAFFCPVPTKGSPTDVLAARFQAWRKILKDLISYHREIQNHYEQRGKSVQKLTASLNATALPPGFIVSGGLDDATQVLRNYHKQSVVEAMKAREIEDDVILALTGLRSDLSQKIKEIKNISGDFRNSVDKEMDGTKKAVKNLQDVLGQAELDTSLTTGRQDPYLLRLAVDRQLERQLEEENYLHQAFLNLEKSGRELESIVVGEIQKSYNAYAGILKREAGAAWATVDELRSGPVAMPKDHEWEDFIRDNEQFVDPETPIRSIDQIHYPGQNHDACQEIRAGLLERKSKYLKSYTAGWYVLSPTHLHEFKSADKMQVPVMSLYLPEQKLGSHSVESAKSSKFVLKGRQTGAMHRGHTWVFRAESYDTMMAWYEDIKALTEKTPQERNEYAHARGQRHARSASRASQYTYSSDGFVNEDDDDEPFATTAQAAAVSMAASATPGEPLEDHARPTTTDTTQPGLSVQPGQQPGQMGHQTPQLSPASTGRRPSPGGRFHSDLQVNAQRGLELQASGAIPLSPASAAGSGFSGTGSDYVAIAAAGAAPQSQRNDPDTYGYPPQQTQQPQQFQQPQQYQPYSPQQAQQHAPYAYVNGTSQQYQRSDENYQSNGYFGADPSRPTTSYENAVSPGYETRGGDASGSFYPGYTNSDAYGYNGAAQSPVQQKRGDAVSTTVSPGAASMAGTAATPTTDSGVSVSQSGGNKSESKESEKGLVRQDSEPAISSLHMPGGYPRTSTTALS